MLLLVHLGSSQKSSVSPQPRQSTIRADPKTITSGDAASTVAEKNKKCHKPRGKVPIRHSNNSTIPAQAETLPRPMC